MNRAGLVVLGLLLSISALYGQEESPSFNCSSKVFTISSHADLDEFAKCTGIDSIEVLEVELALAPSLIYRCKNLKSLKVYSGLSGKLDMAFLPDGLVELILEGNGEDLFNLANLVTHKSNLVVLSIDNDYVERTDRSEFLENLFRLDSLRFLKLAHFGFDSTSNLDVRSVENAIFYGVDFYSSWESSKFNAKNATLYGCHIEALNVGGIENLRIEKSYIENLDFINSSVSAAVVIRSSILWDEDLVLRNNQISLVRIEDTELSSITLDEVGDSISLILPRNNLTKFIGFESNRNKIQELIIHENVTYTDLKDVYLPMLRSTSISCEEFYYTYDVSKLKYILQTQESCPLDSSLLNAGIEIREGRSNTSTRIGMSPFKRLSTVLRGLESDLNLRIEQADSGKARMHGNIMFL